MLKVTVINYYTINITNILESVKECIKPVSLSFLTINITVHNDYRYSLKKNPVFQATLPDLSEPADPRLFFNENTVFFFVGVFIFEVSILKKHQSRPYLMFLRLLP